MTLLAEEYITKILDLVDDPAKEEKLVNLLAKLNEAAYLEGATAAKYGPAEGAPATI